jgi:hypothetical protein
MGPEDRIKEHEGSTMADTYSAVGGDIWKDSAYVRCAISPKEISPCGTASGRLPLSLAS